MAYLNRLIALAVLVGLLLFSGCTNNTGTGNGNVSSSPTLTASTIPSTQTTQSAPLISLNEYATAYTHIDYAGDLAGKPAYIVTKNNTKRILYNEKEIGTAYDQALMPDIVAGKFFYVGVKNNKYYAVYDGQEIGKDFFSIWSPGEYNGKLIYVAEDLGRSVLVYDGKEISNESYDYVWSYSIATGKIAYLASRNGENYTRIVPQSSNSRRDIPPEGVKSVIVYDGQEIGRDYDTVGFPLEIDGKLAYIALKDGKKFSVVGNLEGAKYDDIYEPLVLDGKLAYIAKKGGKSFLVYDGKEMTAYNSIASNSLKNVNGKLTYRAADASSKKGKYFIVSDGRMIGKEYDNVLSYAASGEKQAYVADVSTKRFIVYQGVEIGKEYDSIDPDSIDFYNGKLTFIAQKSGVWYIISEK